MRLTLFGRTFEVALAGMLIVELLSAATIFTPAFQPIFWVLLAGFTLLALQRIDVAFLVLLGELFIGSTGRLFSVEVAGFSLSLRLALFMVFFLIWSVRTLHSGELRVRQTPLFRWFLALLGVVGLGTAIGALRGNALENVFFDVNGYLFLALVFPFFNILRDRERLVDILQLLAAAVVAMALKTLFLLAVFSHQYELGPSIYTWVRDTRTYEVAYLAQNFYRAFSQSHIFSVAGLLIFGALALFAEVDRRVRLGLIALVVAASTTVLLSFSRSFWVAIAVSCVLLLPLVLRRQGWPRPRLGRAAAVMTLILVCDVFLISLMANYPYLWNRPGGASVLALLEERTTTTDEAAIGSRRALLGPLAEAGVAHPLLGSGFGTTVTFSTEDPRVVSETGGTRTTYAFEWGYLDFLLKIGLVGLLVYLGTLWRLWRWLWSTLARATDATARALLVGLGLSLLTLVIIHAFTPYLNHPLGIGLLLFTGAAIPVLQHRPQTT